MKIIKTLLSAMAFAGMLAAGSAQAHGSAHADGWNISTTTLGVRCLGDDCGLSYASGYAPPPQVIYTAPPRVVWLGPHAYRHPGHHFDRHDNRHRGHAHRHHDRHEVCELRH